MRADEWEAARAACIDAFDEPGIPELLDILHSSWGWDDELAFVAARGDEVVALVLFTPCFVDAPDRVVPVLVLSPVGVCRRLQRQGVGDALVRFALAELERTRPEPAVFLEGIPSYYPRFGFRPGAELGFAPPSPRIPAAAFMVYPLPAYDASVRGNLVYADAFWRADAVGLRE
ncbi:MAG: GNAT family N-acetyltransferase [Actinomycetota bacterium]|nr:GNAT family N-acetyltransferase [Actinomycetota bacterium]